MGWMSHVLMKGSLTMRVTGVGEGTIIAKAADHGGGGGAQADPV